MTVLPLSIPGLPVDLPFLVDRNRAVAVSAADDADAAELKYLFSGNIIDSGRSGQSRRLVIELNSMPLSAIKAPEVGQRLSILR